MGRAPCCDKVGLKKGPWTPEEDEILINFVQKHGHSNWRALPKQAGLLRCGKSCRLRWINYLRPDIKRGNFSREEEETIIQLHEMMGNRWSAIAARLPGRTDNEIKNVWHTHLKKRLKQYQQPTKLRSKNGRKIHQVQNITTPTTTTESTCSEFNSENSDQIATSPQQSYTISEDFSSESLSVEFSSDNKNNIIIEDITPIIDDTFWESPELPFDDISNINLEYPNLTIDDYQFDFQSNFGSSFCSMNNDPQYYDEDNMDFWLDVFVQAGGAQQLPEF